MTTMKRPRAIKPHPEVKRHPEPKLRRMAEIVQARALRDRQEAMAAATAGPANGTVADNTVTAEAMDIVMPEVVMPDKLVTSSPQAAQSPVKEEEKEAPLSDEAIAEMSEQLETLQKKKHTLFVRLKEMLKEEEKQKAVAEAERQEREQQEQQERHRQEEEEEKRCSGSHDGMRCLCSCPCLACLPLGTCCLACTPLHGCAHDRLS